jgi:hypothetical protein
MNENENIEPVEPVQSTNIVDYLVNLLSSVGLNSYFIHKPDGKKELDYITFNFTIDDDWYSNDCVELEKYLVTINHMTQSAKNIMPITEKMKQVINNDEHCYAYVNRGKL